MDRIRFVLIGCGWRAGFFIRIAAEIPERFEITAIVLRTMDKAAGISARYHAITTDNLEKALLTKPDFVVLCIPRENTASYLERIFALNIPVLCETPPGASLDDLKALWAAKERLSGRIQVAEQYFLHPYYSSVLKIVRRGQIGTVNNVSISSLHGYHAISIIRQLLNTSFRPCKITGKGFSFPVTQTNSRTGADFSGNVKNSFRDIFILEFDNGTMALVDFDCEQYFSTIRSRKVNVQGVRGEICDMTIRYLDDRNRPVTQELKRIDLEAYNVSGWYHHAMMLAEENLYQNPFPNARLSDDEIAVADCLVRMKQYVETGKEFYPLNEALQDSYLGYLMDEAVGKPFTTLESARQPWAPI